MHRTITGEILYTSDKAGRKGEERGREYFTIICHKDGRRTLQAHCEIDDAPNVLRLVTTSVDAEWRPTDAFVRLSVGDAFRGATSYLFRKGEARCEGFTANEGRITQQIDLEAPLDAFGAHPIQNDAWLCNALDRGAGPGMQRLNLLVSSLDHRGATGPTLCPVGVDVEYVGKERVSVAAGDFDALHFRFGAETWEDDDPLKHPVYHLWCTADGNFIFLKGHVEGYMQTRYELVRLAGL